MEYLLDRQGEMRLAAYLDRIGAAFRTEPQRGSFAVYAMGLMGDGERKSAEPMAARACPDPDLVDSAYQRLAYFTRGAEWSDRDVRMEAARYALEAMTAREPVLDWIIDDTGFPKQGRHSVGVQRQYTGTLGKVGNCQVGVSLSITTRSDHVPVDFALYLPESWTEDPARRADGHIPKDVGFKTKPELALEMIQRAVARARAPAHLLRGDGARLRWRELARLRAGGPRGLCALWRAKPRLRPLAVRGLSAPLAGGVLVRLPRVLSVVPRPSDVPGHAQPVLSGNLSRKWASTCLPLTQQDT
jgi:hypothetical protein